MRGVAVRDGVIAAHSAGTLGDMVHVSTQLHREKDVAIGGVGSAIDGLVFAKWYFAGHDMEELPVFHNREGHSPAVCFSAIVLTADGYVYWDDWFVPDYDIAKRNPFMAIGAGAPVAIGAMHMGASAIEAVEASCKFNLNCALPIDSQEVLTKESMLLPTVW